MTGPNILIADDHPLFRLALRGIMGAITPDAAIAEAEDYDSAARLMEGQSFDLLLADLMMPGVEGMTGLLNLIAQNGGRPVIVVTGQSDGETIRAVRLCGAAGLIDKRWPPEKMANNIRIVLNGGTCYHDHDDEEERTVALPASLEPLTDKQVGVFNLLVKGKSNKEIANILAISPNTVKAHISEILRKFSVSSRFEVMALIRHL